MFAEFKRDNRDNDVIERLGRPRKVTTPENIKNKIVLNNRKIKFQKIAGI